MTTTVLILLILLSATAGSDNVNENDKEMSKTVTLIMRNVEKRVEQIYELNFNETLAHGAALSLDAYIERGQYNAFMQDVSVLVYAFVVAGYSEETSKRTDKEKITVREAQAMSKLPLNDADRVKFDQVDKEAVADIVISVRKETKFWEYRIAERFNETVSKDLVYVDNTHFTDQLVNRVYVFAKEKGANRHNLTAEEFIKNYGFYKPKQQME